MRTTTAVAAAALAALIGCGTTGSGPVSTDYYPLTPGSTWRYRVCVSDSTGRPDTAHPVQWTGFRIAGTTTIAGADAAVVVQRGELPYETFDTSYVQKAGGCVLSYARTTSRLQDTMLVVPPAAGRSWHRLINGKPLVEVRFERQEAVQVPAGTFAGAWRTDERSSDGLWHSASWYAPGVGLAKYESRTVTAEGDSLITTVELTSFSVR